MAKKDDDVRAVMIETAKVQVATLNASIEFWSSWVDCAGKFARAASKELIALGEGDDSADEVLSRITNLSREYLTKITELPDKALVRFKEDLKPGGPTNDPHRRSAKVKE